MEGEVGFVLGGVFCCYDEFPRCPHAIRAESDTGTLWYGAHTSSMKCERILCMRSMPLMLITIQTVRVGFRAHGFT